MPPASALLAREHYQARASTVPFAPLELALGRAHALTGTARRVLALVIAAARPGPVLWIAPGWVQERLTGPGATRWIDPARLLFVHPTRGEDLLWCCEEALRSGATPTVVCELPSLPGLTPVRRLHLAAERGMEAGTPPLGLLLTAEGTAPGVETAWSLEPQHTAPDAQSWRLERRKARSAPPADWPLTAAPTPEGRLGLAQAPCAA